MMSNNIVANNFDDDKVYLEWFNQNHLLYGAQDYYARLETNAYLVFLIIQDYARKRQAGIKVKEIDYIYAILSLFKTESQLLYQMYGIDEDGVSIEDDTTIDDDLRTIYDILYEFISGMLHIVDVCDKMSKLDVINRITGYVQDLSDALYNNVVEMNGIPMTARNFTYDYQYEMLMCPTYYGLAACIMNRVARMIAQQTIDVLSDVELFEINSNAYKYNIYNTLDELQNLGETIINDRVLIHENWSGLNAL